MTSTGVIKAQQQENPNFPHRLPYPPCDQLILRRAGLDEVKPAKYLCEFRGRMALLDHSSLSNLILHFAVRVPLCPWCGRVCHTDPLLQGLHNIKVLSRLIQGSICPGDQSCCHGTDLHSHPQPVCQGDAQNSEVTVSDTNQSYSTFSAHNRCVSYKRQPLDPSGTCTFRRQNVPQALSTAEHRHSPGGNPDFPPCHGLQQEMLLTGGPGRPIPGTPLSPGCPGRPGAPLSPWNKGKS